MNTYKDVKQDLVGEIPAVERKLGWKAPVDVRVASSKEEAKEEATEWAMGELERVALFSEDSLIDGMVGATGMLMMDEVVRRVKGAQLESAERYGVYEAEGVGRTLGVECLREELDEVIQDVLSLGLDNFKAAITTTASAKPGPGHHIWNISIKIPLEAAKGERNSHLFSSAHRLDSCTRRYRRQRGGRRSGQACGTDKQFRRGLWDLEETALWQVRLALTHLRLLQRTARKQLV
ncbi:hypothetical protein C8R44DRAFT_886526 [Mycena epipterygia]|nr:hypothetical protein C8R44DRAFT_886526 [Mycena epipterygia]